MAKITISDLAQSRTNPESCLTDLKELSDKELKAISGGMKMPGSLYPGSTNIQDRRYHPFHYRSKGWGGWPY
jgi:bacteriocin-like protein